MVAKKKTELCCSVHTGELLKTITILLIQMASLSNYKIISEPFSRKKKKSPF